MTVSVDARELVGAVRSYRDRVGDMSSTMANIAEMLVSAVDDRWNAGGDGQWPPLAASTLRARRGSEAQILVDTGRAISSVQANHGPDFAEASTDVDYMVFHASDAPRSVIPYRNPFDLRDDVLDKAAEMIAAAIVQEAA